MIKSVFAWRIFGFFARNRKTSLSKGARSFKGFFQSTASRFRRLARSCRCPAPRHWLRRWPVNRRRGTSRSRSADKIPSPSGVANPRHVAGPILENSCRVPAAYPFFHPCYFSPSGPAIFGPPRARAVPLEAARSISFLSGAEYFAPLTKSLSIHRL